MYKKEEKKEEKKTVAAKGGDREKAIEAGCNDFISKPLVLEELKVLIRKYFNI